MLGCCDVMSPYSTVVTCFTPAANSSASTQGAWEPTTAQCAPARFVLYFSSIPYMTRPSTMGYPPISLRKSRNRALRMSLFTNLPVHSCGLLAVLAIENFGVISMLALPIVKSPNMDCGICCGGGHRLLRPSRFIMSSVNSLSHWFFLSMRPKNFPFRPGRASVQTSPQMPLMRAPSAAKYFSSVRLASGRKPAGTAGRRRGLAASDSATFSDWPGRHSSRRAGT
mmetsp:Transcript_65799/g.185201  ORF Transcript_65799/g.185201 Transcript_65799/m.185201 type:complete len:225 (+) Transcript_65799:454-1128(+)